MEEDGLSGQFLSQPLHDLVDTVFRLQSRGWLRRQVWEFAHQMLDLWVGDTIDHFLAAKLRIVRSEETVAKALTWLHKFLWPGGEWMGRANLKKKRPQPVDPNVVKRLLLDRGKQAAVSTLLGKNNYRRGVVDLLDMIQSPTYMKQIGVNVVEAVLVALFPELKGLVMEIRSMGTAQ
ncbi:hypothetical protein CYMTET_14908 [Cymbomonas tetramitiformis]|uniref:Sorting nexin C-terminal domain-containing protein n=1 Tax=Cymbomonas tetramitiformis TaxID=36881 RepID=A0AAE0GFB5_9CHLO|nr:hypothetical protein CYMTET_14908 [Cymbomonas tetramitiformis]